MTVRREREGPVIKAFQHSGAMFRSEKRMRAAISGVRAPGNALAGTTQIQDVLVR